MQEAVFTIDELAGWLWGVADSRATIRYILKMSPLFGRYEIV